MDKLQKISDLTLEVRELEAQLARCVDVLNELTWIVDGVIDEQSLDDIDSFTTQPARVLLASLPKTANLDAEILRCAEVEADIHKIDKHSGVRCHSCDCDLCEAVRAKKDVTENES